MIRQKVHVNTNPLLFRLFKHLFAKCWTIKTQKMGKVISIDLMASILAVMVFFAVTANGDDTGPNSVVCKVKLMDLAQCLPAITGVSPPKPTEGCCKVLKKADLPCLCKHKADLSRFGANPAKALELPQKCGLGVPQECKKKHWIWVVFSFICSNLWPHF